MQKPKYIIGVDAALRNVGISVLDNMGSFVLNDNLTTQRGMTDHDSVDMLCEKFYAKLERYLDSARVYIELINFGRMGKSTARAEAAGVIKWNLRQTGTPIYGIEPGAWQSWFSNAYGFAYTNRKSDTLKRETIAMVHRHLNVYTQNDNVADAAAIGRLGYAHTYENARISVSALYKSI